MSARYTDNIDIKNQYRYIVIETFRYDIPVNTDTGTSLILSIILFLIKFFFLILVGSYKRNIIKKMSHLVLCKFTAKLNI